jgi:hypothetical protein
MTNVEKLEHNIKLLCKSDHTFNPHYMVGVVMSNLKTAKELYEEGSVHESEGMKMLTSVMVASLYDCPISDDIFITEEMTSKFFNEPLQASKLGKFAMFTISIFDNIIESHHKDFSVGFLSALAADLEIAVAEMEAEELL